MSRFAVQFDLTPDGPALDPVEDPQRLDQRRAAAGLGPIAEQLQRMHDSPRPTPSDYEAKRNAALQWRISVGWVVAIDNQ